MSEILNILEGHGDGPYGQPTPALTMPEAPETALDHGATPRETLRDRLAMAALPVAAWLVGEGDALWTEAVADRAYELADALLRRRRR